MSEAKQLHDCRERHQRHERSIVAHDPDVLDKVAIHRLTTALMQGCSFDTHGDQEQNRCQEENADNKVLSAGSDCGNEHTGA